MRNVIEVFNVIQVVSRPLASRRPHSHSHPHIEILYSKPHLMFSLELRWVPEKSGLVCSGSEAGSYLRLIDFCMTQL